MPVAAEEIEEELHELHKMYQAKQKLDELVRIKADFDTEMERYRVEEANTRKFRELLDELNQEKMARVEELKQINTDINHLETAIKQCEMDTSNAGEQARRMLEDVFRLRDDTNTLRRAMGGVSLLPQNIVNEDDCVKLLQRDSAMARQIAIGAANATDVMCKQEAGGTSAMSAPQSTHHLLHPLLSAQMQHLAQLARGGAVLAHQHHHQQQQQQQLHKEAAAKRYAPLTTGTYYTSSNHSGASARHTPVQSRESTAQSSSQQQQTMANIVAQLPKQKPVPMKICSSCQQEIHRNAPICPNCKSKSRSKNPKKPKQRLSGPSAM